MLDSYIELLMPVTKTLIIIPEIDLAMRSLFILTSTVSAALRRNDKPIRIPVKRLARVLGKSRKVRRLARKHIRKNVPKSSAIH